jgi:hypothetical protein
MNESTLKDLLQQLEALLKEKPDFDKLPGGSGYRNGYADGYKLALNRFKECRERSLKKAKK